jgi:hypothetical protein
MGIRFLGTPIEQFDQLCKEAEKVMITVSCYKSEETGYPNTDVDGNATVEIEDAQTGGWGRQIRSKRDIFEFDYDSLDELIKSI